LAIFGRMCKDRALAILLSALSLPVSAQLVMKKSLLAHLGAGIPYMSLSSGSQELSASGMTGGAVDFSFAYAFSPRWSLGFHYQWFGTGNYTEEIDRLRLTRYELEGGYRVMNKERHALEVTLGLGAALIALHDQEARLPAEALTRSLSIGARYIHMITRTVGAYACFNASPGGDGALSIAEVPLQDENGAAIELSWNSTSLLVGAAVRF
jgi:hypothetical protein